jgi:hypothetical protein
LYRLRLWTAAEPVQGLFVFANGLAEGGNGRRFDGPGTTVMLEQGGVRFARYTSAVFDAGKMLHPIAAFGSRVLSTRNPLIGIPDGYVPVYPYGIMLSGERGKVDYRVAAVSLPPTHRDYVPSAEAAARPVVGIGITPLRGLRIGVGATVGPYLNSEFTTTELNARSWKSYDQRVLATDVHYGFGHFDVRTEFVIADFDVPYEGRIDGQAGYGEVRATLTPRWFAALRGEFNRYPFIRRTSETSWLARRTELRGVEAGGGYRFGANTTVKLTVSADDWVVNAENAGFIRPGGKAIAVQLTREFDLLELVARR